MTDPSLLLPLTVIFLAAGMVKGLLGLGLPTLAMGLLGLFLDPAASAALLLLPSLLTNLWQAGHGGPVGPLLRRLAPLLAGIVVGTVLGAPLMGGDPRLVRGLLGLTLMIYAGGGLRGPRPSRRPREGWGWSAGVGGLTGLLTGATGVFVLPAVPYLATLGLDRGRLVQALGLSFSVSTLALAAVLAAGGRLPVSALGWSALAVGPALVGMALGARLRRLASPATFRRLFFGGLLALGGEMVLRAAVG
ncbi:TSUP family transporter [Pararhodospirillum photometricum]|nr:TSUP family transporter [Pararhodospirillum photometricum]